tara:strand:- start:207 stop:743 length:537 start_codon:yes stop_codon:yes gene_type:complete
MLGFSPLASAAIGDDGLAGDVDGLSGISILTGTPIVSPSELSENIYLSAVSITTGIPTITQPVGISLTSIVTGVPTVSTAILTVTIPPAKVYTGGWDKRQAEALQDVINKDGNGPFYFKVAPASNLLGTVVHDYISYTYTGINLTRSDFYVGGPTGTVVSTLLYTYDSANNIVTVTRV